MSIKLLLVHKRSKNLHYINRYIKFIRSRTGVYIEGKTHRHHILPKAKDMFPQFKSLDEFQWNSIHLTHREHFIAHWILSKAFPGSSQSRAFYYMTNINHAIKSKEYEVAKQEHVAWTRIMTQCPERNKKISKALTGKPKSPEHIKSLTGHNVSDQTREKLRTANLGKKLSVEQRRQMSTSRTGKSKAKNSLQSKINIAKSKCDYLLVTPLGTFESHLEAAIAYNVNPRRFVLIFQNLDVIPRKKVSIELKITLKEKTYYELGFRKLPK